MSDTLSLADAARDYIWLYDSRRGASPERIAARAGLGPDEVRAGIARAEAFERRIAPGVRPPADPDDFDLVPFDLVPVFPIGQLTPQSACPHDGPIPLGSRLYCTVCHASGMEDHPGLRRDDADDTADGG